MDIKYILNNVSWSNKICAMLNYLPQISGIGVKSKANMWIWCKVHLDYELKNHDWCKF